MGNKLKIILLFGISIGIVLLFTITGHLLKVFLFRNKIHVYQSTDKSLYIQYKNNCRNNSRGRYSFNDREIDGSLTYVNCILYNDTDSGEYIFTDYNGKKRCSGRMIQINSSERRVTIWIFENAVKGYKCPLIGEKIQFKMNSGSRLLE